MKAINNSQGDFYVTVLAGVYHDLVGAIIPQSEVKRDLEEIQSRVRSEGLGFLTKTLPKLGKAIDRSLGQACRLQFEGFKKKPRTQLPAFGYRLISLLFTDEGHPRQAKPGMNSCCEAVESPNKDSGSSNALNPSRETMVMALKALRQIAYLCYKVDLPYREELKTNVIQSFEKTEQDLRGFHPRNLGPTDRSVLSIARRLVRRVLANADPLSGIPRHGPGSVSTGEKSPEKHIFKRYYKRLDSVFHYPDWMMLNWNHVAEDLGWLQSLPSHKYGEAKVVLVPKDSRGPRLISAEPLEYQWIQQSLLSVLVPTIEGHNLTKGHVNFTLQNVNRDLALEGSRTGRWATLDMKDASDRVSLKLVHSIFPDRWFRALYASRTPFTRLPSGKRVAMKKFAPMGSAVCFPIEALTFWSLIVSTLIVHRGYTLRKACTNTYVYGDDIVVNVDDHDIVCQSLERFALKVNRDKCCVAGFFRESCGMDAFLGSSVTPLKLRKPWLSKLSPAAVISYTAFCNAMYADGCFVTAEIVERYLRWKTKDTIPVVSDGHPAINCFIRPHHVPTSPQPRNVRVRYNANLHQREVQGLALRPTSVMTKGFGYPLLLRLLAEMERKDKSGEVVTSTPSPKHDETGYFAIAHREKPTRAWTRL